MNEFFKGIVVGQLSWATTSTHETVFTLLCLYVPLVMVTYVAAEEIIAVLAKRDKPWLSMEIHTSTVFKLGNREDTSPK